MWQKCSCCGVFWKSEFHQQTWTPLSPTYIKYDTNIPYIINVNNFQFHKPRCASVAMVAREGRLSYTRYYTAVAAPLFYNETADLLILINIKLFNLERSS